MYRNELGDFWLTILAGLVLAGLFWSLASRFSRLWNRRFHITRKHHRLCSIAALLTFVFTVTYVSLHHLQDVAKVSIDQWNEQIREDQAWSQSTTRIAYDEIKALGLEDFSDYPHPDDGGLIIPASHDASQKKAATIFSGQAVRHFDSRHPVLSWILWVPAEIATEFIDDDIKNVFKESDTYPTNRAIDLAARWIKKDLAEQVPRVVRISRITTVLFFILVQLVPFGLIAFEAYRDLKISV